MNRIALAAMAAIMSVLPVAAADVSGNWTFAGDVVGNPVNVKCTFRQDAGAITGTCTHEGRPGSPTKSTVAGNKVVFRHQVEAGEVYNLTFTRQLSR